MSEARPDLSGNGLDREPGEVRHLPISSPPGHSEPPPIGGEVLEPAGPRTLADAQPSAVPAPLVMAAGGALVGLATCLLARVLRPRPRRLAVGRARRGARALEVTSTRSFLVDVHVLRR
jgi:hypothetical protein